MATSLFLSPSVAADIDRAEGRLCAGFARGPDGHPLPGMTVDELSGGVVVFAGAGAPTNKNDPDHDHIVDLLVSATGSAVRWTCRVM